MTMDFPYDQQDFDPFTQALLALFRRNRLLTEPNEDLLAMIELLEDMPADMKALLHTWAYLHASAFADFGQWTLQPKSVEFLDRALDAYSKPIEPDQLDRDRAIAIGAHGMGHPLVATWAPGDRQMRLVCIEFSDAYVEQLGSVEDLVKKAQEEEWEDSECAPDEDPEWSEDLAFMLAEVTKIRGW